MSAPRVPPEVLRQAPGGTGLPFYYTDPDGDVLTIGRNGDGRAFVQTTAPGVQVAAGDLAGVFRAMCAAAGTDLRAALADAVAAELEADHG